MSHDADPRELHGLLAEYADEHDLLEAVHAARSAGHRALEAFTPMPVEELAHALGHRDGLRWIVLAGGIVGALGGYALQYWASVMDYPVAVGGRPLNAWPAFLVVSFEMAILFASLAAVFGMLALNGLPRLHHPLFDVPLFDLGSGNRFFLMILARDPAFDAQATREHLERGKALSVTEVPE